MGGRRDWFKHDAWFLADDKIRELGHEFGAPGPLVAEAILELAKRQKDGGRVRVRLPYLREHAFCKTPKQALDIVYACAAVGFIEILDESVGEVALFLPKWLDTQGRGISGAERTQQWRDRKESETPVNGDDDVTSQNGHGDAVVTDLRACSRTGAEEVKKEDEAKASRRRSVKEASPEVRALCRQLAEGIIGRDPDMRQKLKPDADRWLTDMRLLVENDGRGAEKVGSVITWIQTGFWGPIVLSPGGLRENFPKIWGQMQRDVGTSHDSAVVESSAAYAARRGVA